MDDLFRGVCLDIVVVGGVRVSKDLLGQVHRRSPVGGIFRLVVIHYLAVDDIAGEFNVVVLCSSVSGWCEGKRLSRETYGEFSDLGIVHSENLGFFAGTETAPGNEVQGKENDTRSTK